MFMEMRLEQQVCSCGAALRSGAASADRIDPGVCRAHEGVDMVINRVSWRTRARPSKAAPR